jgi:hypothetical protein
MQEKITTTKWLFYFYKTYKPHVFLSLKYRSLNGIIGSENIHMEFSEKNYIVWLQK